ncbi:MFS general substrate transporter [Rozella allomycis CSF55]|uniref:Lysosomal dipeptide transporter MFSD1 n=1 Tax=Rozella allomycis (strain CSF55) TaxID=988480 RepID=A0A075APJ8_ROZAC|nr:Major facilitator superfamily, general substrate transporter domain-containing protein [Rozella allomycis CSF55]RKP19704.1 MFS general substrate transporter [Rozella allomycis CSF55]|eukprot:EPZ32036.1 Major facilitator superfamily, general substrate transporter domain-containing protein [Rozella allomycis CSF55]
MTDAQSIDETRSLLNDDNRSSNTFIYPRPIFKILAILCTLLISFGSHYESHLFASLKSDIKKDMNLTNLQFHLLSALVSIPNTVIPLLGGLFLDAFGSSAGSMLASFLIFLGTSMNVVAVFTRQYYLLLSGRFLYGIGAGCIVIIQETILTHWFYGKSLAFAVACQFTFSRLSTFVALSLSEPISEWTGYYGYSILISCVLCGISFLFNGLYLLFVKYYRMGLSERELQEIMEKKKVDINVLFRLPYYFWLITLVSMLLTSCWNPFIEITTEFLYQKFNPKGIDVNWSKRGVNSMIIPVLLSTPIGIMTDKYGRRCSNLILSGFTAFSGFILLQYTEYHPLIGLMLVSLSLTLGPVAMISSIPLIIPLHAVGTAFGVYKSSANIGAALSHQIVGRLQDNNMGNYDRVMSWLIVCAFLATLFSFVLLFVDGMYAYRLTKTTNKFRLLVSHLRLGRRPNNLPLYVLLGLAVSAWVILIGSLVNK